MYLNLLLEVFKLLSINHYYNSCVISSLIYQVITVGFQATTTKTDKERKYFLHQNDGTPPAQITLEWQPVAK